MAKLETPTWQDVKDSMANTHAAIVDGIGNIPKPVFKQSFSGATKLSPFIDYRRASEATYWKGGKLLTAQIDEPVFEDGAWRLEPQGTNYCINSTPTSGRPVSAVGVGTTVQYLSDANGPYVQVDYDGSGNAGSLLVRVQVAVALGSSVLSSYLWGTTNSIRFRSNAGAGGPLFENPTPQMEKVFTAGYPYSSNKSLIFYPNGNNDSVSFKFRGVQLEEGEKPTSYIPTNDSPTTRSADLSSYNLQTFLNPQQGTLVFKGELTNAANEWMIGIQDSTSTNLLSLDTNDDDTFTLTSTLGSETTLAIPDAEDRHTFAIAWINDKASLYIDGIQHGSDINIDMTDMQRLVFNTDQDCIHRYYDIEFYNERLTDGQINLLHDHIVWREL